jgi:hypothetical protein
MSHLLLGPIVGHTDHASTTIWIRVGDDPADYSLRVHGRGLFPFASTEPDPPVYGSALALADGLRPEWEYRYHVLRRGRVIPRAEGTFRTMPLPGSDADVLFVSLSCSDNKEPGAWPTLSRYIKSAKPRFLVMMGDQIYVDEPGISEPDIWHARWNSDSATRRRALAGKYQDQWSREPLRTILANTPTYMMWDDHDIRNGWGSFAPDSPTLAAQYPRGAKVAQQFNAYFEDARDAYWHFQACRNPLPPAALNLPGPGARAGMPFWFRCGRLAVLILDNRGARDLWRTEHPVLGDEQWTFLTDFINGLPADVDALALVVPLPLTSMSATGKIQKALGDRTDDVDLFKKGDAKGLVDFGDKGFFSTLRPNTTVPPLAGPPLFGDPGSAKLGSLSDVRDNWANHFCRGEQADLITTTVTARLTNRIPARPRALVFIGGDLHAGGLFDLAFAKPDFATESMVTSGISKNTTKGEGIVGILMDEEFDIADGIHAKLKKFTHEFNFGVTHIVFGGEAAVITNAVAHDGDSSYWSLKLADWQ